MDLQLDAASRVVAGPITPAPPPPELPGAQGAVTVGSGTPLWLLDTGGGGEPVVLLHPGVGDLRLWSYQVAALTAAAYRVVAYDRPGHGRSPALPPGHPAVQGSAGQAAGVPRPDTEADLAALASRLGLGQFHLVGAAQGARIAADFARHRPGMLLSLTLSSATLFTSFAQAQFAQGQAAPEAGTAPGSLPPGFTALPAWFRELGPAYRLADPAGVARWRAITGEADERRPAAAPPGSGSGAASRPAPGPGDRRVSVTAGAAGLPVRTLAVTGDADPFAPPPGCRAYAAGHPGCALAIIPESGHSPFWERPELFNAALLAFLARRDLPVPR